MIELEFYGAAGTVTGSSHILRVNDTTILLDCGLFQGRRQQAREKNQISAVAAKSISSVIISHAHIDHSGRLPRLYRDGYNGPTLCTPATAALLGVMLSDSAHIQEEDAKYWNEKRAATEDEKIEPLYTADDVLEAMGHFVGLPYGQRMPIGGNCHATFYEAGHVLGSASTLLEIPSDNGTIKLLYTGDLGRFDMPILRDPVCPLPEADYLITESTYANRRHADGSAMKQELARIINKTVSEGGKIIIPAFSLGRTQHLVYSISQAMEEELIEPLPVYVDSPLSVNITHIFREHPECYDEDAKGFWRSSGGIFDRDTVRYITNVSDSKALNNLDEPCVIISSSGMCEFGRILHHLKNNIEDEKNTIVIVGFQAENTLGRRISERAESVKIYGRQYEVLADIEVLTGFSAHADEQDFDKLIGPIAPKLKGAFAVHGEAAQLKAMQAKITGSGCKEVFIPEPGQKFELK